MCRSLISKLDELRAIYQANKPDIVCLVETWLSTKILTQSYSYQIVLLLGMIGIDMAEEWPYM